MPVTMRDRRRGPSPFVLFLVTCVFMTVLLYKGEYDSCVRNQAIRAAYNDSFEVQRQFLTTARKRNLAAAKVQTGRVRAQSLKAARIYKQLIDGQRPVRELDCGPPFPDNS